jgi:hypothetical protein
MVFLQKLAWTMVTHVFAACIILDMMFSRHLDNVGSQGLLDEYDFIIGKF